MAFYSQGKEFLNLPEQVEKNKTDIADLKTKEADTATDVATNTIDIAGLKNRTSTLESRTNSVNGSILTGSIQAEKNSEFGTNVTIDGGLTLNSPSDLHFKRGDTDYTDYNTFKTLFWDNIGRGRYRNASLLAGEEEGIKNIIDNFAPYYTDITHYLQNAKFRYEYADTLVEGNIQLPDFPSAKTAIGFLFGFPNDVALGNMTCNATKMFYSYQGTSIVVGNGKSVKLNGGEGGYEFTRCSNLIEIGEIDLSSVSNLGYAFQGDSSLKHIHCKHLRVSFNISASTKFEQSDLVEIIGNLDSVTSPQTLTMGATNLAKLTQDQILVATGKGWTLA